MATIAAGGQAAVTIPAGYKLSISAGGAGSIYAMPGGSDAIPAGQAMPYGPSAFSLGPFTVAEQVMVYAAAATTYSVVNAAAGSLNADQAAAVEALVSEAGNVDAYATDVWQEITATGLAIPLPVTVKAIKLIGGTSPTLALRDALVDTYSASSASTDVAFDSSVTPVQLGYEYPLNKTFRLGVHATVGGTGSPKWAIKI